MIFKKILECIILLGFIVIFVLFNIGGGMNLYDNSFVIPILCIIFCLIFYDFNFDGFRKISILHIYAVLFGVFCFLSILWATDMSIALNKSISLVKRFGILFLLFLYCYKKDSVRDLLMIVMLSNYFTMFIVIWFYGLETVIMLLNLNIRVDNDLLNANVLGMGAAYSFIISLYYMCYEKNIWNIIISIPSLVMVAFSGSKKAGLILAIGTIFLVGLKNFGRKNVKKTVKKIVLSICSACIILLLIFNLPIFENMLDRFDFMLNIFSNEYSDGSTEERYEMILLGLDLFAENILCGVGIDNACLYNAPTYYFLHSNPIELLADVGVVGFCLYYWIYILILYRFFKYKDFTSQEYIICLVLFIIFLPMSMAYVAYSEATTYLYLALFYYESILLKRKASTKHSGVV